jgi:hypothetical protein
LRVQRKTGRVKSQEWRVTTHATSYSISDIASSFTRLGTCGVLISTEFCEPGEACRKNSGEVAFALRPG